MLCSTLLTAVGQLFWKLGSEKSFSSEIILFTILVIIGFFLYGLALIFLTLSLKMSELSYVYPFLSLGYIWTFFIGVFTLNESFSVLTILGLLSISIGILVLGFERRKKK